MTCSNNPTEIQVAARNKPAERISQTVLPVDKRRKRELLSHRIGKYNMQQVLVFTRTKRGADRLSEAAAERRHQRDGDSRQQVAGRTHARTG